VARSWQGFFGAITVWGALQACTVDVTGSRTWDLSTGDPDRQPSEPHEPDTASDAATFDAGTSDAAPSDAAPSPTARDGGPKLEPSPPEPCGEFAHGAMQQRQRYAQAVVAHYADCVPEEQVRVCRDGVWTAWSGTARAEQCAVGLLGQCNDQVPCAEGACVPTNLFTKQCLATNGMPCSDNAECVNRCIEGVCANPSPAGGPCDEAADCDLLACIGGSGGARCENATCVCPNGSLCADNAQCQGTCVGLTCVARGASCDPKDDDDCDALSVCVNRRCLRPDGTACETNAQCEHVCAVGTCGPRSGQGGPCDEDADCEDGLECGPQGPAGPPGMGSAQAPGTCRKAKGPPPCAPPDTCASQVCACAGGDAPNCPCNDDPSSD
jgi:hypothetical protein